MVIGAQKGPTSASKTAVLTDVAADLVVAAGVAVLVAQATVQLHGGVTLLGRGLLVIGEDGVDDGVEGAQDRGGGWLAAGAGLGLGTGEDLADLAAGMSEGARAVADRHAVAVRQSDVGVVVHRPHPCLRSVGPLSDGAYWNGCGWGGSILLADLGPGVGPFCAPITTRTSAPEPGRGWAGGCAARPSSRRPGSWPPPSGWSLL
jgi:hypothetical protein